MNKSVAKSWLERPFPLLDDFRSRIFLILFCGVFATFFIYFFNPFNIRRIEYDDAWGNFLYIWSSGIWGALVLFVTQIFLRGIFDIQKFRLKGFILWIVFEFYLICLVMFLLFGESNEPLVKEYFVIVKYTVSLTVLPYFLACLIIAVVKLTASHLSQNVLEQEPSRIQFIEENGKMALALNPENLIYMKSENNYTSVVYDEKNKVSRKLVRTNLKKIENELKSKNIIRIHRSYMINLDRIESVEKAKNGYQVRLAGEPENEIKVSGTYRDLFTERLNL